MKYDGIVWICYDLARQFRYYIHHTFTSHPTLHLGFTVHNQETAIQQQTMNHITSYNYSKVILQTRSSKKTTTLPKKPHCSHRCVFPQKPVPAAFGQILAAEANAWERKSELCRGSGDKTGELDAMQRRFGRTRGLGTARPPVFEGSLN